MPTIPGNTTNPQSRDVCLAGTLDWDLGDVSWKVCVTVQLRYECKAQFGLNYNKVQALTGSLLICFELTPIKLSTLTAGLRSTLSTAQ